MGPGSQLASPPTLNASPAALESHDLPEAVSPERGHVGRLLGARTSVPFQKLAVGTSNLCGLGTSV